MARITIDAEYPLFPVEPKLFGHFTEHAFGNIYGGLYDPDSTQADETGLRKSPGTNGTCLAGLSPA